MENTYVDCKKLALKKVRINGDVIGKFGVFETEQTFINDTKKVLEVGYTFPIAETATVTGFEVIVGDKVLKGVCKETKQAKQEYAENMVKGNSAYILEEKSDNIFAINIGKIDVGEEVKIKIKYIDKFEIVDNQIKVFLPTLVPHKYKSNITSKLLYGKVDYTVDFSINISKCLKVKEISSPTHKINISDDAENQRVTVLNYDLSKDFKLDIDLAEELCSNALCSVNKNGQDILYLSFMPEIQDTYEDTEKDYIFLIDVSGSMDGEKLEETKKAVIECLKQLDEGDTFNIVAFESDYTVMSVESLPYTQRNLKKAISYVKSLESLGGTEILDPVRFALYEQDKEKIVLLFTDGEVGNEREILDFVDKNIGKSRIFPFGIDYNVNSYFIRDLAKIGQGKAEFIAPKEKIDDKIIRTFARIQTPLLDAITVDYGNNRLLDEIKEDKALFNFEFYNVFAKVRILSDDITLKGYSMDKEYSWTIKTKDIAETNIDLEVLFAKEEIDRLEEYISNTNDFDKIDSYKTMIINLSEQYNINSKYTSFLTVYERENKILELPQYQETVLSSNYSEDDNIRAFHCCKIRNMVYDLFADVDDCDELDDDGPFDAGSSKGLDCMSIPSFLKSPKERVSGKPVNSEHAELRDKIREYFEEFMKQSDFSLVTYLLFGLFDKAVEKIDFVWDKLISNLQKRKDELLEDEEAMEILYLLCREYFEDEKLEKLLSPKYQKALHTGLNIAVTRKGIDEEDIPEILENDLVEDEIDEALWYFCAKHF